MRNFDSIKTIKKGLKNITYFSFYYSGLLNLIEKGCFNNPGIPILCYHRVGSNDFDPLGMSITTWDFEKQIKFLKNRFSPVPLDKAIDILKRKESNRNKSIAITFDDGYKDNFFYAYPILKKYDVPATFFLTVNNIENRELLWFDKIINSFKNTEKEFIDLSSFNLGKHTISSADMKADLIRNIVLYAKTLSKEKIEYLIDCIMRELGTKPNKLFDNDIMLTWDNVITMKNHGFSFGSHGMTHSILTKLPIKEFNYELEYSKKIIEKKLSTDVRFFSYPNGTINDFNAQIADLLKKTGYSAACTLVRGINDKFSGFYTLNRLNMSAGMYTNMFGRFSKSLFSL